jgi:hypothetical protein
VWRRSPRRLRFAATPTTAGVGSMTQQRFVQLAFAIALVVLLLTQGIF